MNLQFPSAAPITALPDEELAAKTRAAMARVYLWMMLGLLATALASFAALTIPPLFDLVTNQTVFFGLIIGELGLVLALSFLIRRLHPLMALLMFFVYAVVNGLTLAMIFLMYELGSVGMIFVASACLFGAMAVIGHTTRRDLTSLGGFLLMGVLGLIIGSIINVFFANDALSAILTYAGIAIFIGLTAYDAQHIKNMTVAALAQGDTLLVERVGIIGALSLYLDFINLFLRLLRAFGRRR